MRAMVMLLLGGLLLVGCRHPTKSNSAAAPAKTDRRTENQSPKAKAPTSGKATPVAQSAGRVASVNPTLRFVVIDFAPNPLPQLDQRLGVYRQGQKVGEVKISRQANNSIIAADITQGEAQLGDEVRPD